MKKQLLTIACLFSALGLLSACAVDKEKTTLSGIGLAYQSNVKTLPDGAYYVEVEAAPAAGRVAGARGVATNLAYEHCKKMNKKMSIVEMSEDSHLLINGVVKLKFKCE